jgi:hypothetical protein
VKREKTVITQMRPPWEYRVQGAVWLALVEAALALFTGL